MPDLTRRRYRERSDCWHVYYGDVHVGTIARAVGIPNAEPQWNWLCGFYPGSNPGDQRGRADFETAWRFYLPKRSEADFQAWRDQQAWTAEKYRRFDRGEPMPRDWRAPHG